MTKEERKATAAKVVADIGANPDMSEEELNKKLRAAGITPGCDVVDVVLLGFPHDVDHVRTTGTANKIVGFLNGGLKLAAAIFGGYKGAKALGWIGSE